MLPTAILISAHEGLKKKATSNKNSAKTNPGEKYFYAFICVTKILISLETLADLLNKSSRKAKRAEQTSSTAGKVNDSTFLSPARKRGGLRSGNKDKSLDKSIIVAPLSPCQVSLSKIYVSLLLCVT